MELGCSRGMISLLFCPSVTDVSVSQHPDTTQTILEVGSQEFSAIERRRRDLATYNTHNDVATELQYS